MMGSPSAAEVGDKGSIWDLHQKFDRSMDEEAGRIGNMHGEKKISTLLILRLAFQSLGVVFGDLGTSPLYVFYNTFAHGVNDPELVIGALSLIIYSLTLIPLLKYVFVVLRANDNGQGGTFALYSLLCRHAKISTLPNHHRSDEELTTYSRQTYDEKSFSAKIKTWLEAHAYKKNAILILVLIGTCTAIGDGILTPAISVLSATGGIKVNQPHVSNDVAIVVAVIILVGLFSMQHYGTDRVSWLFAPVVLIWFLSIGFIGAFNIWKYDSSVLKAFNPVHIYRYFKGGRQNWTFLGGIMLSITGTEALFADLCHFPVLAIQIAFSFVVFPCLLLAYTGQAAYILQHQDQVYDAFYRSIPDGLYWPVFAVATIAAIIASQATISATFSIVKQAMALGCFPRVKVVHTSKDFLGQIYIPEINWIMMILCIAVTVGFKNQTHIGNAYGTAVVIVMLATTLLMVPIMLLVWGSHWASVTLFTAPSLLVELTYFSAVLLKVDEGGWAPLAVAAVSFLVMYVWHYVTLKRYELETHSTVSMAWILGHGYRDLAGRDDSFERTIVDSVAVFVRLQAAAKSCSDSDASLAEVAEGSSEVMNGGAVRGESPAGGGKDGREDEVEFLNGSREAGVVHIMGKTVVRAQRSSNIAKKIAVDYVYAALKRICRENSVVLNLPHESLLNIGQVFYV